MHEMPKAGELVYYVGRNAVVPVIEQGRMLAVCEKVAFVVKDDGRVSTFRHEELFRSYTGAQMRLAQMTGGGIE